MQKPIKKTEKFRKQVRPKATPKIAPKVDLSCLEFFAICQFVIGTVFAVILLVNVSNISDDVKSTKYLAGSIQDYSYRSLVHARGISFELEQFRKERNKKAAKK